MFRRWWRHVHWWFRGTLRVRNGPFTEGSVVMLVELFFRERPRPIRVVTALIACGRRNVSEDARSIGSVAAVIGELYWGFAFAFSGAFSLAFAGAFAFTSSLAGGGILGLAEELGTILATEDLRRSDAAVVRVWEAQRP